MQAGPRLRGCLHAPTRCHPAIALAPRLYLPPLSPWVSGIMSGNATATADPLAALKGVTLTATYGSLLLGTFFGLMCAVLLLFLVELC